jgi:hypothetical protein
VPVVQFDQRPPPSHSTSVCRTFGVKRSTLIDSLARIGWSAGRKVQEA